MLGPQRARLTEACARALSEAVLLLLFTFEDSNAISSMENVYEKLLINAADLSGSGVKTVLQVT